VRGSEVRQRLFQFALCRERMVRIDSSLRAPYAEPFQTSSRHQSVLTPRFVKLSAQIDF